MHGEPARHLRYLFRVHGLALVHQPRRVEAFLHDLCPQHDREIFVLVQAQRLGIPQTLLDAHGRPGLDILQARLARQLQERRAFTPEAATWAVHAWTQALGVRGAPGDETWTSRLAHAWSTAWLHWMGFSGTMGKRGRRDRRGAWIPALVFLLGLATGGMLVRRGFSLPLGGPSQIVAPSQPGVLLAGVYPPPWMARIREDALPVYATPGTLNTLAGYLGPPGSTLTVWAYSSDGLWAQVREPLAGWLPLDGVALRVRAADDPTGQGVVWVRPAVQEARVTVSTSMRVGPWSGASPLAELTSGNTVWVVAVTLDGAWAQVASPGPGWIPTQALGADPRSE